MRVWFPTQLRAYTGGARVGGRGADASSRSSTSSIAATRG